MTVYAVADGFDVADESLNDLSPQPTCKGIQSTRRTYGGDGSVYDEGEYVEFLYSTVGSVSQYQSILTAFGINSALTNEVTIRARDETFADVRLNGVAVRPRPGEDGEWSRFFPRNVVILVKDVSTAS